MYDITVKLKYQVFDDIDYGTYKYTRVDRFIINKGILTIVCDYEEFFHRLGYVEGQVISIDYINIELSK